MFDKRFRIENDLSNLEHLLKTDYADIPFDKGLFLFRKEIDKLAEKYNTTSVDIGKLFFDRLSSKKYRCDNIK